MVGSERRITPPPGVRARRSRRFDDQVLWNLGPPRMRYEDTVVDLADRAQREVDAIAVLADACGGRRTTAARLRGRIDEIARLHRRALLGGVLRDVQVGTCSVLEHRFLTHVERPHGLPGACRQAELVAGGRRMVRDVLYGDPAGAWAQVVELDGRLFHESAAARDRDLERDLDAAIEREHTVRVGYGQVFDRACATAGKLGRLLQVRGWAGAPVRCGRDCVV